MWFFQKAPGKTKRNINCLNAHRIVFHTIKALQLFRRFNFKLMFIQKTHRRNALSCVLKVYEATDLLLFEITMSSLKASHQTISRFSCVKLHPCLLKLKVPLKEKP